MMSRFENKKFLRWFCVIELAFFVVSYVIFFVHIQGYAPFIAMFSVRYFNDFIFLFILIILYLIPLLLCTTDIIWFYFAEKTKTKILVKFCYLSFKTLGLFLIAIWVIILLVK
jgi:hypothetical protein